MNVPTDHQQVAIDSPELDALVLTLHGDLAALRTVEYRLSVLRLMLLDGNAPFIQNAAHDVEHATAAMLEAATTHDRVIEAGLRCLDTTETQLSAAVIYAPASHRAVLVRITGDLAATTRRVEALRDTVRRLSEDGRRTVLDLTDTPQQIDIRDGLDARAFLGDL